MSENEIASLLTMIQKAIEDQDYDSFKDALKRIHYWKTRNRQGQTSKYYSCLNHEYVGKLLDYRDFNIKDLREVITMLKVEHCNLPICSAIASFLYGRNKIPIIDKFIAQFFARQFRIQNVDEQTKEVLEFINIIKFRLENGGNNNLRLAVFTPFGFDFNLKLYINELVPECERIANVLQDSRVQFKAMDGRDISFTTIDIEMSIFSWASKNASLF